ncbi:LmbU family transcriptional regulator [Amycolatopsis lurida]
MPETRKHRTASAVTISQPGTAQNDKNRSGRTIISARRHADDAKAGSPGGLALTRRTSLRLPPSMSLDEWRRIGQEIFIVSDSSAWWLGDWLVYGQSEYPSRYQHAIMETRLDYQTLRNYAWVARKYPEARRRSSLSFQHHAELTSLPEHQQEKWLDRAEKYGWSRNELRSRVRADRDSPAKTEDGAVRRIMVRCPSTKQERWLKAAANAEQDLLSWIVRSLDDAATAALSAARPEQEGRDEPRPPAPTTHDQ